MDVEDVTHRSWESTSYVYLKDIRQQYATHANHFTPAQVWDQISQHLPPALLPILWMDVRNNRNPLRILKNLENLCMSMGSSSSAAQTASTTFAPSATDPVVFATSTNVCTNCGNPGHTEVQCVAGCTNCGAPKHTASICYRVCTKCAQADHCRARCPTWNDPIQARVNATNYLQQQRPFGPRDQPRNYDRQRNFDQQRGYGSGNRQQWSRSSGSGRQQHREYRQRSPSP